MLFEDGNPDSSIISGRTLYSWIPVRHILFRTQSRTYRFQAENRFKFAILYVLAKIWHKVSRQKAPDLEADLDFISSFEAQSDFWRGNIND